MIFSKEELASLRNKVSACMSEKRFTHTLGVEKMAAFLGNELDIDESELRAAALLHDIAKEIPIDEQIKILEQNGFPLTEEDRTTPGIIHSFTGPFVVKRYFPEFATDNVLNSILYHTVGAQDMTVFHKIIFISDYVEENRAYDSCISVRNLLLSGFESLTYNKKLKRLDEACLASLKGVFDAIRRAGRVVNSRMVNTFNSFNT